MTKKTALPMPPVPKNITVDMAIPKTFDHQTGTFPVYMPFYYASVSCIWVYYAVDPATLAPYVAAQDSEALVDDGQAFVNLNFQTYTGHGGTALETVTEVEFNAMSYPSARASEVVGMTFPDYLNGQDQTKTVGNLRIHVPADNAFAVAAGKAFFGEPKFLAGFDVSVPALNNPPAKTWQIACNDEGGANIFKLDADVAGLGAVPRFDVAASPLVEYSMLDGRLVGSFWDFYGPFDTHAPIPNDTAVQKIKLSYGDSAHPMRADMEKIIGGRPAIAVRVFTSLPVATESRAYYADR
jgi:hypothetical protein